MTSTDATESGLDAYRLGRRYEVMPIPMDPAACLDVPAGPLTFVVEGRRLTDDAIVDNAVAQGRPDGIDQPDGVFDEGTSIHVLGTADGQEHLRFDCFEREPHYHYIRNGEQANIVVRIDTFAEGDALAWTLGRLRDRLPHMLGHAGAGELADQVRAAPVEIAAGVERVERIVAGR